MEALKWQRKLQRKGLLKRRKQRRRKRSRDVIILDYHKAIGVSTLMAFLFFDEAVYRFRLS
jgi:hypothetical protein